MIWSRRFLLLGLAVLAACAGVENPGKSEPDPFTIHVGDDGKADGEAGLVSAEDLARIDGALADAIERGEATIAQLEQDIATLERDNQRKLDEIEALLRQIAQRRSELEAQHRQNLVFCFIFPNPATCVLAVMITNDSRMQSLERDRAQAQGQLDRGRQQLARYLERRDVLRAEIVPLREARTRLIALLREGVPAAEVPAILAPGSAEARAYGRAEALRRIAVSTHAEIALLVEIRDAAAELSASLDDALATVRALASDVDRLVEDARGDFMDMIEAILSGDADSLARDWLDDALAARTRELLAGLDWPAGELVDHLIANRAGDETDPDALARRLLEQLGGATDLVLRSDVELSVLDNTTATSTLEVAAGTMAGSGEVAVRIRHTWIGDLRVTLEHGPDTIVLHDRTGGSDDDLIETYTLTLPPGYDVRGPWRLKVADQVAQDQGRLLGWTLTLQP